MANPDQGEITFKDRNGKEWTLTLTNRAVRAIETELKKPWGQVLKDIQDAGPLTDRLAIFTATLRVNHPNGEISDDAIIDLCRPAELYRITNDVIRAAYKEELDSANPPTPSPT